MPTAAPLADALFAAAGVIAAVLRGRALDDALAELGLEGPPRAAVQDLAYGALRRHGLGDFLLAALMARPVGDPLLRGLLLAALYRLEARPADAHTTVDQAVRAAGRVARGRFKALSNGVLRNFLRRRGELLAAAQDDAVARWQHPRWWIECLRRERPTEWQAILAAGNGHPPMCLRVNRRRLAAADYCRMLAAAGVPARALDDTAVLLERPVPIERLPAFAEGHVSVQDWGAQRAAPLLDAHAGMRVLDACAAPGGKSAHLLERADLALTALDADPQRAERVRDTLRRLDLAAEVKCADARALEAWWDGRPFERILADVPCSASGVVRRHPDIKWLRREADVAGFAQTQAGIIEALWRVLAPGGRMLYCTCSVFRAENEAQVEAFAARHADARRLPTGGADTGLLLTPDAEHDGFYYALLEKRAP